MIYNLVLVIIFGCVGYFIWFAWYLHRVEVQTTLAQAIEWFECRRDEFLKEVGGERVSSGKGDTR